MHTHTQDTQTHLPPCLLRYWPLSDVWEVSGLNTFSLWAAGCRGLLGQHTTAHPYQQIGNTVPAGLPQLESRDECVYT